MDASAARDNARIAADYRACPVKLLAIATGDLFFSDEIDGLSSHLAQRLPRRTFFGRSRDETIAYLDQARRSVSGASWQGEIWLQDSLVSSPTFGAGSGYPLGSQLSRASILLSNPMPGIAMMLVVYHPTAQGRAVAERIATSVEIPPPLPGTDGMGFTMPDVFKENELAGALRSMIDTSLFPTKGGGLGEHRFPDGTFAIWSLPDPSVLLSNAGPSIRQILGLDPFVRWEGEVGVLYRGLPGSRSQGFSWLLPGQIPDERLPQDHEFMMREYAPWTLLDPVIEGIREQAATLRLRIESNRIWKPKRPSRWLPSSARVVEVLRYRVSRISLVQPRYRRRSEFPKLTRVRVIPAPRLSAAAHLRHVVIGLVKRTAPPIQDFRSDIFAWIDEALKGVADDLEITSRRADAQLRVTAAVVTVLVLLATLILVIATLILVILAAKGR
jgi:hypothetical protein